MNPKVGLTASVLTLGFSVVFFLLVSGGAALLAGRPGENTALVFELPISPTALPSVAPARPAASPSPQPARPLVSPTPAQLFFRCNDGTRLVGTSRTGACEGRGGIALVSEVPLPADDPVASTPVAPASTVAPPAAPSPTPPPTPSPNEPPSGDPPPSPTPTSVMSFAPTAPNAPQEGAASTPQPADGTAAAPTATATVTSVPATSTPTATPTPSPSATARPEVTVVLPEQQPQLPSGNPASRSSIAGLWHKPIEDDIFLGRIVESGAGWVRTFLTWEDVEPTETSPPSYNWSASDRAIRLLRERGVQPLVNIVDPPSWAAFPTCGPFRSTAMQDRWLQFVRAAVERYSQPPYSVRMWMLYNEPDFRIQNPNDKFGGGWGGGCWGNHPTEYGAMLRATYPVIKAADPAAVVVMGPLAADGCGASFNCAFLREVLDPAKGNAGGSFDVASFNYFPFFRRNWEQFGTSLLGKAEGFRRTMAEVGVAKPVLVAETGIVLDGTPATATAQANYVAQALTLGLVDAGRPDGRGVQAVIWFTLRDSDDPNDRWGLLSPSGEVKPPFVVYQTWVKELAGLRFVRTESEPTYGTSPARVCDSGPYFCDALQKYVFASGDLEKWVLWIDAGPQRQGDRYLTSATRTVEAPADRMIALRDRNGATVGYEVQNGRARFVVGDSPLYVTLRR